MEKDRGVGLAYAKPTPPKTFTTSIIQQKVHPQYQSFGFTFHLLASLLLRSAIGVR
jgi:hypothetical protein